MHTVTANELKTKGVSILEAALLDAPEAVISVRGRSTFVVMGMEHYERMRECELEAALQETRRDLKKGNYKIESVARHIKRITKRK